MGAANGGEETENGAEGAAIWAGRRCYRRVCVSERRGGGEEERIDMVTDNWRSYGSIMKITEADAGRLWVAAKREAPEDLAL